MGIVAALTASLVIWIVLWSLGAKGFDAFMPTFLIMTIAAAARLVAPYLPGNRGSR